MSFDKLKRRKTKLSDMVKEAESGGRNSAKDERFWQPTADSVGTGSATIRFLPSKSDESVPWVKIWDHGFQGPTGLWYIENSRTTIGEEDPVSEYNSKLWETGLEMNKKIARDQKRRLHYISNIMVISDPANPKNDGQVFLFKYGSKLFDKIKDAMSPEYDDETPYDPFDFWEGANFRLKFHVGDNKFRTYEKSQFSSVSPLSEDDSELEAIYNKMYDLSEFVDPANFKSYEELKLQLRKVLRLDDTTANAVKNEDALEHKVDQPIIKESAYESPTESVSEDTPDDDDNLAFFERLANED